MDQIHVVAVDLVPIFNFLIVWQMYLHYWNINVNNMRGGYTYKHVQLL